MLCSEVRGQDLARGYFRGAIRGGRLSHAYLLAGPEGVGKRRFADGLTAALLCRGRSGPAIGRQLILTRLMGLGGAYVVPAATRAQLLTLRTRIGRFGMPTT